jgi:hypothetical protein
MKRYGRARSIREDSGRLSHCSVGTRAGVDAEEEMKEFVSDTGK